MPYIPYSNSRDPRDIFQNERGRANSWWDQFDDESRQDAGGYRDREDEWGRRAQGAYDPLYYESGYNPEERANILREQQYGNLDYGQGDYDRSFLTDDERGESRGDPRGYLRNFRPDYMRALEQDSRGMIRQNYDRGRSRLDEGQRQARQDYGETPDFGPSEEYRYNQEGELAAGSGALRGSLSGSSGRIREALGGGRGRLGGVLGEGASAARGAIDPSAFQTSARYEQQVPMTDAEVQGMAEAGGRDVGARYGAAIEDMERRAAAAGNASPMALAAGRARLERDSTVQGADAQNNARLAARAEQARRAQMAEDTRMTGGQNLSRLRSGMELELGDRALGSEQSMLDRELGAEERIGGRELGVEGDLMDRYLQGRRDTEMMRQGGTRDAADFRARRAEYLGNLGSGNERFLTGAGIDMERDIANRQMDTERWAQGTGMDAERDAENEAARRAYMLATNRQGAERYGQDARFGRGMSVQDRLRQGWQDVAGQRRDDLNRYRDYATGSRNYYGGQYNNATNNRLQAAQIGFGASGRAAQGQFQADEAARARPSTLGRILNAGIGAASGFATGGPVGAIVGGTAGALGSPSRSIPAFARRTPRMSVQES